MQFVGSRLLTFQKKKKRKKSSLSCKLAASWFVPRKVLIQYSLGFYVVESRMEIVIEIRIPWAESRILKPRILNFHEQSFAGFRNSSCYTIRTSIGFSADILIPTAVFHLKNTKRLFIGLLKTHNDVVRCGLSLDVSIELCFMVHYLSIWKKKETLL